MSIFSGLQIAKEIGDAIGGKVTEELDKRDVRNYFKNLERPENVLGKAQAKRALDLGINPYFLLNEPTEALKRQGIEF